MTPGDGVLIQAQVGGEASTDVRYATPQSYQQPLVRSLDLNVAARLAGSERHLKRGRSCLAAHALVKARDPIEELGHAVCNGGASECLSSHTGS